MKRVCLAAAALLLFSAASVCAAQTLSSKITEATLFFDQARVCRQASAQIESGIHSLLIPIEEFSIDQNSVTAEIYGQGEILGVQVAQVPVTQPRQEKIRELESRREELLSTKQAIKDQKTSLSKQQEFLEGVIDFSGDQIPKEIKTNMPATDKLEATLAFLGKRFSEILDEKRAADKKLAEINKRIDKIERELHMLRGRKDETATGIEILFRSEKSQAVEIKTCYMVSNAGWSPVYRATAPDAASDIELSMMAEITQKTGEDWEDITLTVSSMVPVKGNRLPELSPWRLDIPRRLLEKSEAGKAARMKQLAAKAPGMDNRAGKAEAERRRTPISFEYTMPAPVKVASREQKTVLPVFSRPIRGDFYYRSIPKKDSRAYLVCKAEADNELLAGPVSIFFAERYVGEMFLEEKQPGQSFLLGMGADRSVKVTREKVRDYREETAFFGQIERETIVRELKYRISVENIKDRPIKIHILDNVPVSATDRITVKDVSFAPEPEKKDVNGKNGVMQWLMELKPGETSRISISFTVAYPKDMPHLTF